MVLAFQETFKLVGDSEVARTFVGGLVGGSRPVANLTSLLGGEVPIPFVANTRTK